MIIRVNEELHKNWYIISMYENNGNNGNYIFIKRVLHLKSNKKNLFYESPVSQSPQSITESFFI